MTKHIGIVVCSAEGAALFYRTICSEAAKYMGDHMHPEITMHSHPLGEYMDYIKAGDWEGVAGLMLSSARKVAESGADFAVCPDNTIHQAFDLVTSSRRSHGFTSRIPSDEQHGSRDRSAWPSPAQNIS